jgi:hypothetical protein
MTQQKDHQDGALNNSQQLSLYRNEGETNTIKNPQEKLISGAR